MKNSPWVAWVASISSRLWRAHVTVTPAASRIAVFSTGTCTGLNALIPVGGQVDPSSIVRIAPDSVSSVSRWATGRCYLQTIWRHPSVGTWGAQFGAVEELKYHEIVWGGGGTLKAFFMAIDPTHSSRTGNKGNGSVCVCVCVTATLPITGDTWQRTTGRYGPCNTRQGGLVDTGLNNTTLFMSPFGNLSVASWIFQIRRGWQIEKKSTTLFE